MRRRKIHLKGTTPIRMTRGVTTAIAPTQEHPTIHLRQAMITVRVITKRPQMRVLASIAMMKIVTITRTRTAVKRLSPTTTALASTTAKTAAKE